MSSSDDMPTRSESRQELDGDPGTEPRPLSRWLWILVPAFLLAYPFSIGPVVWLARSGVISPAVAMSLETYFYGPLILLCELSDTSEWLLRGYAELWAP